MQHIKDILIYNVMIDELFHKVAFNFHIMNNTILKGVWREQIIETYIW